MSKKATEFQRKAMSRMYRGKEIFQPLNTGWTDNFEFAFAHKEQLCSPFKKRVHDSSAPYDAYDESDDTEENARHNFLQSWNDVLCGLVQRYDT